MGRVRVIVDTTEERSRAILADHLRDEMAATGVLIDERGDIVDETSDNN